MRATAAGTEAVATFSRQYPDLLVLDIGLPDADGRDVCQALRARGMTAPVVFLTARDALTDRLSGFKAGGDDYLIKPFAFEELLARIRVMTRRQAPASSRLFAGSIEMDLVQRTVTRHGRGVELLPQEFLLLEYLLRNADRAVTRKMLLENVWGIHFDPNTSVVESHISRLRARLNAAGESDAIQTVRGTGYRLLGSN